MKYNLDKELETESAQSHTRDLNGNHIDIEAFFRDVSTVEDISTDRLLIGQGFNSITGEQCGNSVIYEGNEQEELGLAAGGSNGQIVAYNLEMVESFEQIKKTMKASAAISLGWGVFSSDLTFEFMSSGTFTQYNVFMMIKMTVLNPAKVLKRSRLTQPALLRAQKGAKSFNQYCGDSYVYGKQTGGQILAIVQFSTTSQEDHEQVKLDVKGTVAGYGSGHASFEQSLDKIKTIKNTKINIVRKGGVDVVPSMDSLIEASRNFPQLVGETGGNPIAIQMLLRRYNTVEDDVDSVVNLEDFDTQAISISKIASLLDKAYLAKSDIRFISENKNLFKPKNDLQKEIDDAFEKNENIIEDLKIAAIRIKRDPVMAPPAAPSFPKIQVERIINGVVVLPTPVLRMFRFQQFEDVAHGHKPFETASSIPNFGNIDPKDRKINFNDDLSSFQVFGKPGEYKVEFFYDVNYINPLLTVYSPYSEPNLHTKDTFSLKVGDAASSVRISKIA